MMNEKLQAAADQLTQRFGVKTFEFRGDLNLIVAPDNVVEVCRTLRNEHGFDTLSDITAVDYWPETNPRFNLVYQLLSIRHDMRLTLRLPLSGETPQAQTIEGVWPNANWYEREIWDLMGIRFEGHSDLRRIMMPEDWMGHPLRKDYPLGYEEPQFTFNHEDVDRMKPYAKE